MGVSMEMKLTIRFCLGVNNHAIATSMEGCLFHKSQGAVAFK
jgi:predicted Na+-dependent transporter